MQKKLRLLTFLGITVPAVIGGLALSYGAGWKILPLLITSVQRWACSSLSCPCGRQLPVGPTKASSYLCRLLRATRCLGTSALSHAKHRSPPASSTVLSAKLQTCPHRTAVEDPQQRPYPPQPDNSPPRPPPTVPFTAVPGAVPPDPPAKRKRTNKIILAVIGTVLLCWS
jgi:hypothetical protein